LRGTARFWPRLAGYIGVVPAVPGDDDNKGPDPLRNLLSWGGPEEPSGTGAASDAETSGESGTCTGPESPPAGRPVTSAGPPFSSWPAAPSAPAPTWGEDTENPYVLRGYGPVPAGPPAWPRQEWQQPQWPYQWSYPEPPAPKVPKHPPRSIPGWLGVVLVAAVVGAVVGSGLVAVFANRSPQTIVREYFPGKAGTVHVGDIQSILASVLPAVVSIDTSGIRNSGNGGYAEGAGTGMIIEPSGVIVTNNHVVAGAQTVTVTFYAQSKQFPARVIGVDAEKDIALVQVEGAGSKLPVVHLGNSDSAQQGDGVLAIGNALALAGGETVTQGIVSALNRSLTATTDEGTTENLTGLIQTDAPINPGNSGGPLVNSSGQVVAMNTAVATSSQGNAPAQNVGFAIAVDEIRTVAGQILRHPVVP
jgi:S1-C subfamily serine protease